MNLLYYFRKSINIQLLTLSALLILFTGGFVGLLSYRFVKDIMEEKLKSKDLPEVIRLKSVKIENELEKALKVSQILSSDPELISWFLGNETNLILEDSTKQKMKHIAGLFDYTRIFASNLATKNYYYYEKNQISAQEIKIEKKRISELSEEDVWFFRFWNSKKDYEININKVDNNNTYAYINTIIKNGTKKIGVAGVGVRLTDFVKDFFSEDQYKGKTWLVEKETMKIKISLNLSDIGKSPSSVIGDRVESFMGELDHRTKIVVSTNVIGERTFFAFLPLSLHNAIIVYSVPYEIIMEPLTVIRNVTMAATVVTVLVAFFVFLVYSRKITNPIISLTRVAERISAGELHLRYTINTKNEIGRLAASFNSMTESLAEKNRILSEYSQNLQEKVYEQTYELARQKRELEIKNKSMQKELEMGQKVQGIFLLPFMNQSSWYEVYATSFPSKELGGDFFRVYETKDDQVWIFIGDVSGKGVGSSLIMTAAVSLLDQLQGISNSIEILAKDFNSQLYHLIGSGKSSSTGFFITAGCGLLKREGDRYFIYTVNAGHEPPLLYREGEFSFLPSGGKAFGILADTSYKLFKTELKKGDILLYVTDGIFEQRNEKGEFFEFTNIQKSLKKYHSESMEIISIKLLEDLDEFSTNVSQEDDRTIIALKIL
ncbi:MAG: SpoIIE family protein phosphatase [Leptospiraceae bacterium]|nr:SpoIIE family protein phosphatase [Leptospiraceae bacterium]